MAQFSSPSEERAYLRRVARVLALKALFESDLSPHLPDEALDRMMANVPVSPAGDRPATESVLSLAEPLPPSLTVEPDDPAGDESELPLPIDQAPAVAASFGGDDALDGAEPVSEADDTPLEAEEPAAPGPMEPLSGEQATRVEAFARSLVQGVASHQSEIDGIIGEVAPQWPLADLPVVDRNLLRIAIQEVVFTAKTPVRAAINEAVDLAAEYGSETSPRFVNGVLGTVARRYGARGRA